MLSEIRKGCFRFALFANTWRSLRVKSFLAILHTTYFIYSPTFISLCLTEGERDVILYAFRLRAFSVGLAVSDDSRLGKESH